MNMVQPSKAMKRFRADIEDVMKDYYQTSCGWYSLVEKNGSDIIQAVLKMIYVPGYCNCP